LGDGIGGVLICINFGILNYRKEESMTKQSKKEIVTPEMINEMIVKKGGKPIPMVNQGPKRTWVQIIPRTQTTPKSDTENQDTLNESIDKEEI
jgi:hypothetical protein